MEDKGYPKAFECFEKIWKEGLAIGKWQDDERTKIIFYDWFLTGWILKLKKQELKPDFSGMIFHNYVKDCWQFCDGEIPTDKCINPDYINVDVFITSKKKE